MSTYPPPGHFLGELAVRFADSDGDWRSGGAQGVPVRAAMSASEELSHDGVSVPIGVLATFVDLVAGRICAGAAQPDWVATSDLGVTQAHPLPLGELWAVGRVVRAGRNLVVSTADLGSAGSSEDRPDALATSSFGRLGGDSRGAGKNSSPELPPGSKPERSPRSKTATGEEAATQGNSRPAVTQRPEGSLLERLGLKTIGGVVETTLRDYTSNSLGALQGGVAAMMYERAALDSASARGWEDPWVSELSVRYLSMGRKGPFRTSLEAEMVAPDVVVQRLAMLDCGALRDGEPKRLSVAMVTSRARLR